MHAALWSDNHKKAVKNECKVAVKNGEYLSLKECKLEIYSSINSYGYIDLNRLQESDLKRKIKLKCRIFVRKSTFEYNRCLEKFVNQYLGIERPADPDKPIEIINNPDEPTEVVSVPTSKTADEIYNQLKETVAFVYSANIGIDNLNSDEEFLDALSKAESEGKVATGSAVLVKKNIFATNCHVISTASSEGQRLSKQIINDYIDVTNVSKKTTEKDRIKVVEFISGNQKKDICFIKIKNGNYEADPVKLKYSKDVKIFDKVYALGNPRGNVATFSKGQITGETYNFQAYGYPFYEEDALIFQHDAPIEYGNSGGGLFDEEGNLIAINSAGNPESLNNKNLIPHNYAISIDEFMNYLNE